jgi:hypothetical protein
MHLLRTQAAAVEVHTEAVAEVTRINKVRTFLASSKGPPLSIETGLLFVGLPSGRKMEAQLSLCARVS